MPPISALNLGQTLLFSIFFIWIFLLVCNMNNMIQYAINHTFVCIIYAKILLVKLSYMAKPEAKGQ